MTQVSISGGTGGPGVPTAYQNSDKDSSTTKSAVEKGQLIIRNQDEQKQDINELSRDTESANNPLKQIFDKQKELDKIETVELIKDIAQQTKDVVNKYDRIQAQNDVDKNKDALSRLEAAKAYEKLTDDEKAKISFEKYYEDNKDYWYYSAVDTQLASNLKNGKNLGTMGGDVSKGIDSAVAIVTGIISGDITGGLAGASAPWLAEQIKKHTGHKDENGNWVTDNVAGNLVTHAILGAVVAELQGNSGLSGGLGAVGGELAAQVIRKTFYGDKNDNELTEAEKQNISALAQLATGLAIAVAGGDVGDAGTAIAAGKNAVENNYLCVEATCKLRPGEMTMTGGGGAIVGGALVGSAILAEETGALDGVKDSFNEWLTTGRDGALIKDDGSSNNEPEINNPVTGSGSVAVGGDPGLPPDDDNNSDDDDKKDQEKDSSKSNRDPRDRIQHEDYKDELRAKMEKPDVKDSELKNIMDDLYRPNAKIGSGSTADAVRYEAATGQNVGGKLHLEKAKNYVKALESWLKRNPTASSADRAAAENVLRDLQNALRGK
ncbi:hypothetical protein A9G09_02915 [Gilliamella sp. wkB292]|uniref:VENN motif pre-toxin domain-containing protein n=1 Tax=Gilliamella sp. wkB292 TaxID=3120262 RepID=UPI00080E013E|nr:VENN motif pre-toxin domain-containing protein [Gilliamella apicola]OCG16555.1 hypothetical protein A9G09_02915 [Gilliamella apicola]